jgi:hypothetical protein
VFGNIAKHTHFLQGKRKLLALASLWLNGEEQKSLSEEDRLKYLYLHDLEEGIVQVHRRSLSELFAEYAQGRDKLTVAQLAQLLIHNSTTPFNEASARAAIRMLLPQTTHLHARSDATANTRVGAKAEAGIGVGIGVEDKVKVEDEIEIESESESEAEAEAEFTYAEIDKLFYWKIKMEVPLRGYLKTGLELANIVAEETRARLEEVYAKYDKNSDRKLRYIEFIEMLDDRKKKKSKWEILALYDEAKSKGGLVEFDDFLYNLLLNPALKSFFDE